MSTKYGRNFTSFQNISLKGGGTTTSPNPGFIEMTPGLTQAASTISLVMIGSGTNASENSANEHPYFHISNAGLSLGTGWIRLTSTGSSPYTTLSLRARDADSAFQLPGLNAGIIGVMGTVAVGLEVIGANNVYSTNIVLGTGPSTEQRDMTCIFGMSRLNGTATTRGFPVIIGSTPTNTGVELFFINPSASATLAGTWEMNYVCVR